MKEEQYYDLIPILALSKLPGIGAKLGKQLIAYCGSPAAVFTARTSRLLKTPGIGQSHVAMIKDCDPELFVTKDLDYHSANGHSITHFLDEDYPARLRHFDDAPLLFYSRGKFNNNPLRTVAIVGTRQPTQYGQEICKALIRDLQPYNVQIISGLAYGIDSVAHRECNDLGIENLAIMGTGMDVIYPVAHTRLAKDISNNGGIISEYPIKMRADKENFPRRNRVIAQLADVIIVIESARKGGSLITADFGNQYFKDVFAVPGRIGDDRSEGCNALIKQARAHLLQSAADIEYIMRWDPESESKENTTNQLELFQQLNPIEKKVMKLLQDHEELSIDSIHQEAKIPLSDLAELLLNLEFQGLLTALPGKVYRSTTTLHSRKLYS